MLEHLPRSQEGSLPVVLPGSILQFGDFELDCARFELRHNGRSAGLEIERA